MTVTVAVTVDAQGLHWRDSTTEGVTGWTTAAAVVVVVVVWRLNGARTDAVGTRKSSDRSHGRRRVSRGWGDGWRSFR